MTASPLTLHDSTGTRLGWGVGALLALDVLGGVLAIAADVNTPATAWSSKATLAAPLPMMAAQALLAVATIKWTDRKGAVAAGALAAACLVSGISGFFDGQLAKPGLGPWLVGFQWILVAATVGVGGLAVHRLLRITRPR